MNNQEQAQLTQFLNQLVEVKLTEKNAAAEAQILEAIARQPDAAYLLVQRSLLQDQALQTAQAKIIELQHQIQQSPAKQVNSFLNGDPWAPAPASSNGVPGANSYQIPNAPQAPGNPAFSRAAAQNPGPGFGSSFLGNVATTAAGVVAGSFLFQGIENLMGHHQSGLGQQAASAPPTEQNIVNNYYADDQQPDTSNHSDYLASDDSDIFFDDGDSDSDWV
ncbi:MAG: DUF2076 domain-containing protein [Methylomonas lenta]|nr:DUF2076 domain-containing protein [Methylomonas lenta]